VSNTLSAGRRYQVQFAFYFAYFGFDHFDAHIFKVTKDAEIDIDNDISTSLIQKIEKGLKTGAGAKPYVFVYDKEWMPECWNISSVN
jgi:polyphosphate kinase